MTIPVLAQRRRCWRAKVCWPTIAAAEREAERLADQAVRRGETHRGILAVYYCQIHGSFHVGHFIIKEQGK